MSLDPDIGGDRTDSRGVDAAAPEGRLSRLQRVNEQPWGAFFLTLGINILVAGALAALLFLVLMLMER